MTSLYQVCSECVVCHTRVAWAESSSEPEEMSILKQALQLSVDDFHLVGRLLLVNAVKLTEEESMV